MKCRTTTAATLISITVALQGCSFQGVIDAAHAVSGQLLADKQLVEAMVHDVKESTVRTPASHAAIREAYIEATIAQQTYMDAFRAAAIVGAPDNALASLSQELTNKSARFIELSMDCLGLPLAPHAAQVVRYPREVPVQLRRLSPQLRTALLEKLEPARWSAWDDVN